MSEDLQGLLEKINREGVEKAEAQAAEIVAAAQAKAAEIVAAAKTEAAAAKAEADKAAADYAARAQATIAQTARDTVAKIGAAVTAMLEKVLVRDVEAALADEKVAAALIAEAVKEVAGDAEIAAPAKLVGALKAQLAAKGEIKVVTDDTLQSGFTVKLDGGRVEHSFTGATVAEELAKRLRPDLAKLVR